VWATRRLGPLNGRGVLLVGAGKMSTLAARRLRSLDAKLHVTSREGGSAVSLAAGLGGTPVQADLMDEVAAAVDLVICSTGSPSTVLDRADVEAFQRRRDHRPLCIVDIAVPRDVDPGVAAVAGVELVDLDELGAHVAANVDSRRRFLPEALQIIQAELERTVSTLGQRDTAGPTIAALAKQAEAVRRAELARAVERLPNLDEAGRAHLDRLTRSLVSKLLHAPISHLRQNADDIGVVLTIRDAFDLDGAMETAADPGSHQPHPEGPAHTPRRPAGEDA
ncbi:MAG: hypothetical protein ABR564_01305, partial [Candidatus Dormibacteria bacterium]